MNTSQPADNPSNALSPEKLKALQEYEQRLAADPLRLLTREERAKKFQSLPPDELEHDAPM